MGFCEGGDLYRKLKEQKGQLLPESQVVEWFVQIAMALQVLSRLLAPSLFRGDGGWQVGCMEILPQMCTWKKCIFLKIHLWSWASHLRCIIGMFLHKGYEVDMDFISNWRESQFSILCCGGGFVFFFLVWFLDFIYLFLDRGEFREKEGETSMCGCPLCAPCEDLAQNLGMCPDWESDRRPFGS